MAYRAPFSALFLLSLCLVWGGTSACSEDSTGASDAGDTGRVDAATTDSGGDARGDTDTDARADADAQPPANTPIVFADSWQPVGAADDPFDDRPDAVDCDDAAFGAEEFEPGDDAFKISSQGCDYLTVSQPTAVDIAQGDEVFVRVWHFELNAPSGAEAHLAVATAEHTIWEERVQIPADGELYLHTWTAPEAIAAGEELYFHFHNHGANQYYLLEISLVPPE